MPGTDATLTHPFVSAKADGPDPTLVRASNWNANHKFGAGLDGVSLVRDSSQTDGASWIRPQTDNLTNTTGGALAAGNVVAVSLAADNAVVLSDVVSSALQFVVSLGAPANAATGMFATRGNITGITAQGAIPAGNYVRKSATTKAVEDTGVASASGTPPPAGALGIATTVAASGVVNCWWFGYTTAAVPLVGGYLLRNLVGNNNAGTPNTKFDVSADLVQLRSPSDGSVVVRTNTGTLTNDTGVAGSTANGRDQAGAFGASTWLHFYFIWNGTTLATLSSTVAPLTGPTLPATYTHWAYAGAVYYNASPLLVKTRMRGSWMEYEAFQNVLNAGTATAETTVGLTTTVPPNALSILLNTENSLTTDATQGRTLDTRLTVRVLTGVDLHRNRAGVSNVGINGLFYGASSANPMIPNIGQSLFYLYVDVAGAGTGITRSATIDVLGYRVPNGGE